MLLQLTVNLIQYHIIKVCLYKYVTETTYRRAIRSNIFQTQSYKAAERQTIVNLLLNLTITKTILSTEKFYLEQHKTIIARTTCCLVTFGVGDFNNTTDWIPIDNFIYLRKEGLLDPTLTD